MLLSTFVVILIVGAARLESAYGVTDEEFQQLSRRMLTMESEMAILKEKELAREVASHEQSRVIAELRYSNRQQGMRINELERSLLALGRIETSQDDSSEQIILNSSAKATLHLGNPAIAHKGVAHKDRGRRIAVDGVAFTAMKGALQSGIGTKQNIVFDKVLFNLGNGYHSQHGLFIAPQAGIYLFSTTLLSSQASSGIELHGALMKNGNTIASIYAHGDNGRHDQGGQTIIAEVNVGDEFWVENIDYTNSAVYGGSYSSFSGILIFPF